MLALFTSLRGRARPFHKRWVNGDAPATWLPRQDAQRLSSATPLLRLLHMAVDPPGIAPDSPSQKT